MNRNNSIKHPCDPYENYLDKNILYNESILVAASSPYVDARIAKMMVRPGITV